MAKKFITNWDTVPVCVDAYYASELLRVSHQLVCRYCRQGRLKAVLVGREWRISKDALREYVDGGKEL